MNKILKSFYIFSICFLIFFKSEAKPSFSNIPISTAKITELIPSSLDILDNFLNHKFSVNASSEASTDDAENGEGEEVPDYIIFMGRFHPILVHLPIGFLMMVFLFEIFSRMRGMRGLKYASKFTLILGAVSSVLAAIAGYFLSLGGGYDEELVFWHQWMGIGVAVTAVIALALRFRIKKNTSIRISQAYITLLVINMGLITIAGHQGGSLTHGSSYMTDYTPETVRDIVGMPPRPGSKPKKVTDVKQAVVYTDVINPIIDAKCISCHNPEKKKGGLRLDNPEEIMKGGKKGMAIVAGNLTKSEFYHRLILPIDDKKHMPPRGNKQLSEEEIALVKWWIEQGSPFDKKVADLKTTPEIKATLDRLFAPDQKTLGIFALKIEPANPDTLESMKNKGFLVMPVARDVSFLHVRYTKLNDTLDDKQVKNLLSVSDQVAFLDLSNTKITDAGLADVAKMKNLTSLHLEQTNITDAGVPQLKPLKYLEYLNLYGTKVTDKSIATLVSMKPLKSVYLWQTKVTPAAIEKLKKARPDLMVNVGTKPIREQQSYMALNNTWKFKEGDNMEWASPKTMDDTWENINVFKKWQESGHNYKGYAWYRLKLFFPDSLQKYIKKKGDIKLILGKIDDVDESFLNGKKIGGLGKAKPKFVTAYDEIRSYTLNEKDILWNQDNLIAVRVFSPDLQGGGMYEGPFQLYVNIDSAYMESHPESAPKTEGLVTLNGTLDEGSCCDAAHKAGKNCEHPCCVDAAKNGKVCKDCNPKSKPLSLNSNKKFDAGSCCDAAHKAGKKCEHPCCVEAEKNGKICTDCNPKSKTAAANKKVSLNFDEGSCCDAAKKAGKTCEHPCCVTAAKNGKVCADCNPKSKKS